MENDLCFLSSLSTVFVFGMFIYPNLITIFRLFFLTFFLFLLQLSTFKPLNALYLKFKRLENRRTIAGMKSEVPGRGDPPQLGPLNL